MVNAVLLFQTFFKGLRLCSFLEDHKEDILCGPVWLSTGLDLSGHAGMLTLTSPKLVKGKIFLKYFEMKLQNVNFFYNITNTHWHA